MRAGPYRGIAWWCLCVLMAIACVRAAAPGEVPEATSLLVDEADVLSVQEHDALLKRLLAIQKSQRAQIGVLVSKGTGGAPLSDYALRVAENWKLGRTRRDDGLLLLALAYVSLQPFTPDPTRLAFVIAGLVTAIIATGLYLDSLEQRGRRFMGVRLSKVFYGLAVLLALPFALLALFLAAGGEDAQTQLVHLAAGGGSIVAILGFAARVGLIAAVRVGLGGLFGGGGAGRSD